MRKRRIGKDGGEMSALEVEKESSRRGKREEMEIRIVRSFYKIMVSYDDHIISFR